MFLIPLGNKSKLSERQIPTPPYPWPAKSWGEGQKSRKEQRRGATHILRVKGCGALAVERQEPGHFLPEAGDETDRQYLSEGLQPPVNPKAALVNLQTAATTLPCFPRGGRD